MNIKNVKIAKIEDSQKFHPVRIKAYTIAVNSRDPAKILCNLEIHSVQYKFHNLSTYILAQVVHDL